MWLWSLEHAKLIHIYPIRKSPAGFKASLTCSGTGGSGFKRVDITLKYDSSPLALVALMIQETGMRFLLHIVGVIHRTDPEPHRNLCQLICQQFLATKESQMTTVKRGRYTGYMYTVRGHINGNP